MINNSNIHQLNLKNAHLMLVIGPLLQSTTKTSEKHGIEAKQRAPHSSLCVHPFTFTPHFPFMLLPLKM